MIPAKKKEKKEKKKGTLGDLTQVKLEAGGMKLGKKFRGQSAVLSIVICNRSWDLLVSSTVDCLSLICSPISYATDIFVFVIYLGSSS